MTHPLKPHFLTVAEPWSARAGLSGARGAKRRSGPLAAGGPVRSRSRGVGEGAGRPPLLSPSPRRRRVVRIWMLSIESTCPS